MIGGIDVFLTSRAGGSTLEIAVRAIRQSWPHAVFQNALTGVRYDVFRQIPFGRLDELFVYRDGIAADAWDQAGAIPENDNTMIQLIIDDDLITVVMDARDSTTEPMLAAIRSGLNDDIHYIPVEKAA